MKKILMFSIGILILIMIPVLVFSFSQSNGLYNFEAINSNNEWWNNVSSTGWCPLDNCTSINNSWFSWNKTIDLICSDNSSVSQDLDALSWNTYDNQAGYTNSSVLWSVCGTSLNLTMQNGLVDGNSIIMPSWLIVQNLGPLDITDINTKAILNSHWLNNTFSADQVYFHYANGSEWWGPLEGDKNTTNNVLKANLETDVNGYYNVLFLDNSSSYNVQRSQMGLWLLWRNYTRNGTLSEVTGNTQLQIKIVKNKHTDVIFKTAFGNLNVNESIIYQHVGGGDPSGHPWSGFAYDNTTGRFIGDMNETPTSNGTTVNNNTLFRMEHKVLYVGLIDANSGSFGALKYTFNTSIIKADNFTDLHDFNTSTDNDTNASDGTVVFNGSVLYFENTSGITCTIGASSIIPCHLNDFSTGDTGNFTWVLNTTRLVPSNYTVNVSYTELSSVSGVPTLLGANSFVYNLSIAQFNNAPDFNITSRIYEVSNGNRNATFGGFGNATLLNDRKWNFTFEFIMNQSGVQANTTARGFILSGINRSANVTQIMYANGSTTIPRNQTGGGIYSNNTFYLYNFSTSSFPSGLHNFTNGSTNSGADENASNYSMNTESEENSTSYTAISLDDNKYIPLKSASMARFVYRLNENEENVKNFSISFVGFGINGVGVNSTFFYIWNVTKGIWDTLGTNTNGVEGNITFSTTSKASIRDYTNESDGTLVFAARVSDFSSVPIALGNLTIDFIDLEVGIDPYGSIRWNPRSGNAFTDIELNDAFNLTFVIDPKNITDLHFFNLSFGAIAPSVTNGRINSAYNFSFFINFTNPPAAASDTVVPNVTSLTATTTPINPNNTIELNATCVDDTTSCRFVNIQLTQPNSTLVNISTSNSTASVFTNRTIYTHLIGTYTFLFYANDSAGNANRTTSSTYLVNDSLYVNVTSLTNTPNPVNPNNTIELNTTVVDNVGVGTVIIMLTQPNSSIVNLSTTLNNARYFNRTIFTHLNGTYNWTVYANDTSGLVNKTESSSYQVKDQLAPNVTSLTNTPNPVNPNNTIELNTTVVDNVGVGTVIIMLTQPNSSIVNLSTTLNNARYFNRTIFTHLNGTYNWTVYANDTNGVVNATETSSYQVKDTVNPNVTALQAVPDPVIEGQLISINATVLDNSAVGIVIFEQLNMSVNYTGTLSASKYHNFTVNSTVIGNNTIRVYANDTSGNKNNTEKIGYVVKQNFAPNVTNLNESPKQLNPNQTIQINVTVVDDQNVSSVLFTLTYPNGSLRNYTMFNLSSISVFTNSSSGTDLIGRYNYTIYANDTLGKVNNSESSFYTINDTQAPNVTLIVPSNDSLIDSEPANFTFNATDNNDLVNATLYWNVSGSFIANATTIINGTFNISNFTGKEIPTATGYRWNVLVCDIANNCGFAPTNFTFRRFSPLPPGYGGNPVGYSGPYAGSGCEKGYVLVGYKCIREDIAKPQLQVKPKDIVDDFALQGLQTLNDMNKAINNRLPKPIPDYSTRLGLLFSGLFLFIRSINRKRLLTLAGIISILAMIIAFYSDLRPVFISLGSNIMSDVPVSALTALIALSLVMYLTLKKGIKREPTLFLSSLFLGLVLLSNKIEPLLSSFYRITGINTPITAIVIITALVYFGLIANKSELKKNHALLLSMAFIVMVVLANKLDFILNPIGSLIGVNIPIFSILILLSSIYLVFLAPKRMLKRNPSLLTAWALIFIVLLTPKISLLSSIGGYLNAQNPVLGLILLTGLIYFFFVMKSFGLLRNPIALGLGFLAVLSLLVPSLGEKVKGILTSVGMLYFPSAPLLAGVLALTLIYIMLGYLRLNAKRLFKSS